MPVSSRGSGRCAVLATLSIVGATAMLPLSVASPAWGRRKKPSPAASTLATRVNELAKQLSGVPLDESESLTGQIQQLVLGGVADWMAHHPPPAISTDDPYDVQVRREMERAFSLLHDPIFGHPAVFSQPWNGGVLTGAGYTLGWSDYDRANVIALFETRDGSSRQVALTHFVPHTDLHYEPLSATGGTAFRFLVYGTRLGKSQPRLSAILYQYDGQSLKPLWQSLDVFDGRLEFGKDSVTVRYLKEDEFVNALTYSRKPPRHMAVYKITAQGLLLQSDTEIPF